MLNYIKSLCGVYVSKEMSNEPSTAIRYEVSLATEADRQVLLWKTTYGDGHQATETLPIEDLDESEQLRFDITLPVLERLKADWDFEPAYPEIELEPARVFTFDLSEEIDRFFNDSSIPEDGKPEFVILAGGVCSGKSTIRHEQFADHVQIDAGEIFLNLSGDEYFDFGAMFEEPLEVIGQMIAQRAVSERRNIVTEIIGADADATKRLVEAIIADGYELKFKFIHCDIETAAERNLNRGNNISAHYCEPYHFRWIMGAFDMASTRR